MQGPLPLPGDVVWIRRRRWRVERASRTKHVVRLDVAARDRRITFLSPFDRVTTPRAEPRLRRVRRQCALALLAHRLAHRDDIRMPLTAIGMRADILPHQIEPALAAIAGHSRILIADEVGLGKTVQAGLILAELQRREQARRVLILVPAPLADQWIDELGGRFGLACLRANRAGLDDVGHSQAFGTNPWALPGIWIASVDFLKQRHVADALPADPWDLLVIDEAHMVCGESDRYDLCQRIARRSRRVVLLTATPHGGDEERFERLTSLGRIGARDELTVFRRTRETTGIERERRVRWHRIALSDAEQRLLAALRVFERAVLRRAETREHALLFLSVLRKRALSTTAALSRSIGRRLGWLGTPGPADWAEMTQGQLAFDADTQQENADERFALSVSSGLPVPHERSWLRRLRTLADEAANAESKIERLLALVHRTTEPVIVFTEYRDSLEVIRRRLSFSRAASVLHGGMDPAERRQQLRQFLSGRTSVLLATDVAGQGLNLQSRARWVISLELPWNPARLEQRVGRVDRIGQLRPPHLTLLVARDETESGLLSHLARRVLTARRAIGADAFAGIAPPESDVAAALITGQPIVSVEPAPARHLPSRRWTRPAAVVTSAIAARRALARRWQGPARESGRPIVASGGSIVRRLAPHAGGLHVFVFSIAVSSADDTLVARLLIAVAVDAAVALARNGGVATRVIAEARRLALEEVRRTLPKTQNAIARSARVRLRRERALARLLDHEAAIDQAQPSLFDRREASSFELRTREELRVARSVGARILQLDASSALRAADPRLEFVIGPGGG